MNQSTFVVTGLRDTSDLLAYMVLFLPDRFPPTEKERSIDYWFDLLMNGLNTVNRIASKREGGVDLLNHIKSISIKAQELYHSGKPENIDEGRFLLQEVKVGLGDIARAVRAGKQAPVVGTWKQYISASR